MNNRKTYYCICDVLINENGKYYYEKYGTKLVIESNTFIELNKGELLFLYKQNYFHHKIKKGNDIINVLTKKNNNIINKILI